MLGAIAKQNERLARIAKQEFYLSRDDMVYDLRHNPSLDEASFFKKALIPSGSSPQDIIERAPESIVDIIKAQVDDEIKSTLMESPLKDYFEMEIPELMDFLKYRKGCVDEENDDRMEQNDDLGSDEERE